jgi:hypothetical protein
MLEDEWLAGTQCGSARGQARRYATLTAAYRGIGIQSAVARLLAMLVLRRLAPAVERANLLRVFCGSEPRGRGNWHDDGLYRAATVGFRRELAGLADATDTHYAGDPLPRTRVDPKRNIHTAPRGWVFRVKARIICPFPWLAGCLGAGNGGG